MEDNTTSESLPGAPNDNVVASGGGEAVTPEAQPSSDTISLKEIEETLGKKFENKGAALKAWRDTNVYVGKKVGDIEKDVLQKLSANVNYENLSKEVKTLREDLWYKDNPQFAPYRGALSKVGGNPAEIVSQPEFKEIFENANAHRETQKLKTVLESNPRIASSVDKMSKARDLSTKAGGNQLAHAEAGRLAVEALGEVLKARG